MQKRLKKVIYIALMFVMLFTTVASAATTPSLNLNGNEITTDTPPIIKSGNTLVPIRVISESLGAEVNWDQATRTATVIKDGVAIKLTVDQWTAQVGDQKVPITWPVTLYNSRTLVPIRFVAENLGCVVKWDNAAQKVKLYYVGSNLLKDGSVGEDVRGLQLLLNDCGITMVTVDGIYGETTNQAVQKLQTAAGIAVDGIVGSATRNALAVKIGSEVATAAQPSRGDRFGTATSWWTVNKLWPRGTVATVTDLDSGLSYQVKRLGGSNHADSEPLTAADTAKMFQAYGGEWAWTRHAIIVTYGQYRWAASQNGMPHSTTTIDNNFPGHFCIHFKDSMTHGGNEWAPSPAHVDAAHQAMVKKASGL
ncbi:MAG: stalk domain-containing protein [Methylocystaceae bacterium]